MNPPEPYTYTCTMCNQKFGMLNMDALKLLIEAHTTKHIVDLQDGVEVLVHDRP